MPWRARIAIAFVGLALLFLTGRGDTFASPNAQEVDFEINGANSVIRSSLSPRPEEIAGLVGTEPGARINTAGAEAGGTTELVPLSDEASALIGMDPLVRIKTRSAEQAGGTTKLVRLSDTVSALFGMGPSLRVKTRSAESTSAITLLRPSELIPIAGLEPGIRIITNGAEKTHSFSLIEPCLPFNSNCDLVPDLGVTMLSSPNPVVKGEELTYEVIVSNAQGAADSEEAQLLVSLPQDVVRLSSVPSTGTCQNVASNQVVCILEDIQAGGSQSATIKVRVESNSTEIEAIANVLSVTPSGDLNEGDNTVMETTVVTDVPPPFPHTFAGDVTVSGEVAQDGLEIVGRIGDEYETDPVTVQDGSYLLKVRPPNDTFVGRTITFHLEGTVEAEETAIFVPAGVELGFDLTFTDLLTKLAEKYKPVLYLHPDEDFEPEEIAVMVNSGSRLRDVFNPFFVEPEVNINHLYTSHESSRYIDLPNDPLFGPGPYINDYQTIKENYEPVVYSRIWTDQELNRSVIQYWIFYYFNDWINDHEGDWEMVQVAFDSSDLEQILESNKKPKFVAFSQHTGGSFRWWADVSNDGAASLRPYVYIAKGSHANYFEPGFYSPEFLVFKFVDSARDGGLRIDPTVVTLPCTDVSSEEFRTCIQNSPERWLAFEGKWGESGFHLPPWGQGPQGPRRPDKKKWNSPYEWRKGLSEDVGPIDDKIVAWLQSPAELHIYDDLGRHVGPDGNGGVDLEIPGAEYEIIDDPHLIIASVPSTVSDTEYRIVILGTDSGEATLDILIPDATNNRVTKVSYVDIPVTVDTEGTVFLTSDSDFLLELDSDGDGLVDTSLPPDETETNIIDDEIGEVNSDLELIKTASPETAIVGETLTYFLTVTNLGTATSTNVTLIDELPPGVDFQSVLPTEACEENDGRVTCEFGTLAVGEMATSTIVVLPTGSGVLSNTATVTGGEDDPDADNNSWTVNTTVNPATPAPSNDSGGGSGGGGGGGGGSRPVIAFSPEALTFGTVEDGEDPEPQILRVSTSKNRSVLRFTISSDAAWLSASPIEAISDATNDRERITVSVLTSGLDVGTHTGSITISARRATNDPQTVPVTLVVEAALGPGVISRTRSSVGIGEAVEIITPDNRVQVTVPQGALPEDVGDDVEVEIKNIEVASLPDAPGDTVFIMAIELNTLVDGEVTPTDYEEPVELVFVLTEADLALAEGETSRLGVLWFNEETGDWQSIEVAYGDDPPPAGRLVALLDHFSLYAVGVMEESETEDQQVTETETATPTPAPTATRVPTVVPAPTARPVATPTPAPATPTAIAVVQAAPTPVPTVTPQPTATATPPAPAIPAAPAPPSQPSTEPQAPRVVEESGGIGTATLVILIVVGIAVLSGIAVVGQGLWSRRRQV